MAKPVVDGLERRNARRLDVAHIDIGTDGGRELAESYGVGAVPAFVLVDPGGRVLFRQTGGRPNAAEIERLLRSP
jgi:hypothetical protein